jgi:hypothetical protein
MNAVLLSISLIFQISTISGGDCEKVKNPKPPKAWMSVVLAETYTIGSLKGKAVDSNGDPIANAWIEIIKLSASGKGKVIYVCKTRESGNYQFSKLKSGRYEVRVSAEGYDQTTVRIVVSERSKTNTEVLVPMKAGN